jgi:hypothetical protein
LFNKHVLKLAFTTVFNNFPIVGWNIMKPPWCTHTHEGLSNSAKSLTWCGDISTWPTKETNPAKLYRKKWREKETKVKDWSPGKQIAQQRQATRRKGNH